jgi:diaminopimelate decarboxylase
MTLFELRPSRRHGLHPHFDRAIWPLSAYIDDLGRLCVGGVAVTEIAAEFGTPAYLVDEEDFRARLRWYQAALPGIELVYAAKALLSTAVAEWAATEGARHALSSAREPAANSTTQPTQGWAASSSIPRPKSRCWPRGCAAAKGC